MLTIEWRAVDLIQDGDTQRETGYELELVLLWRDGLNGDVNVPLLSQGGRLGEDLLAGVRRTCGDDRAGLGIPPLGIVCGVGEQAPHLLDWCPNGGNRTCAEAHRKGSPFAVRVLAHSAVVVQCCLDIMTFG